MVGLGRVELPTNGLGIGRLFLNLYVFSTFSLVDFVLFWAWSGPELATDLATSKLKDVPYLRAGDPSHSAILVHNGAPFGRGRCERSQPTAKWAPFILRAKPVRDSYLESAPCVDTKRITFGWPVIRPESMPSAEITSYEPT